MTSLSSRALKRRCLDNGGWVTNEILTPSTFPDPHSPTGAQAIPYRNPLDGDHAFSISENSGDPQSSGESLQAEVSYFLASVDESELPRPDDLLMLDDDDDDDGDNG